MLYSEFLTFILNFMCTVEKSEKYIDVLALPDCKYCAFICTKYIQYDNFPTISHISRLRNQLTGPIL